MAPTRAVTVRAPAKINLELRVGAPREDGFHELATVFQAVSLADDVTVRATGGRLDDGIEVTLDGDAGGAGVPEGAVPLDENNLAVRAVRLLAEHTGVDEGVAIHIRKRIPVAGGMAGGSADGAAALLAADVLWHAGASRDLLRALAAELGSDVPFPLLGGTAIGTGRGEQLTAAMARGSYTWVVATSDQGLSTPSVFAEIDRLRAGRVLPEPRVAEQLMAALRSGNARALGNLLANDLQAAACSLRPDLEQTLEVGREAAALGGLVSGSGPTVVFLVRDGEHALDLSASLLSAEVAEQVFTVTGPVHGARVVEERP
ncbi:MAG: 4-(cytidine 5'-diphospho)-2-C-methyl-D-erythritol kinase [Kineosporiaceae bacterium]|nr:4-(cytidine 5'-diphospho)-2-C-methyl-D-erythritol kinase [Kineosporiaceae bacterium]MBK8078144.1 4-(cytidine 5'-diphospho)-2-C-methyl-D-erythritol kinase [Kineosporiaceae bacterium]